MVQETHDDRTMLLEGSCVQGRPPFVSGNVTSDNDRFGEHSSEANNHEDRREWEPVTRFATFGKAPRANNASALSPCPQKQAVYNCSCNPATIPTAASTAGSSVKNRTTNYNQMLHCVPFRGIQRLHTGMHL